ncbi:hypothetical protein EVG18_05370 [Burkholderia pyrrocinia]|nr:hypothetical protein EVG18_05370 [Burkholderia pyrrocinia]
MHTARFSRVSGAMNCRFTREKTHRAADTAHDDSFVRKILKRDRDVWKSAVWPIRVISRGRGAPGQGGDV